MRAPDPRSDAPTSWHRSGDVTVGAPYLSSPAAQIYFEVEIVRAGPKVDLFVGFAGSNFRAILDSTYINLALLRCKTEPRWSLD